MKLKNSYILLIAMSIFLLINIGSACASDTAMDADIQLADDGFNDILSANETVTAEKTTVVSENLEIKESETANIPVTVKDNASQNIAVTSGDLNVTEGKTVIKFNYNDSKIIINDKLSAGNHSLLISYLGNTNYLNSSTTVLLSIIGNKTLTEAPASVTVDGSEVTIPIVVTDSVKKCNVTKDELTLNLTYTSADGNKTSKMIEEFTVSDSTIKFTLDNTKFVTSNVVVTYTGESKSSKTVAIKLPSKITAEGITVRDNETKNIGISVLDKDVALNVKQSELKVVEDKKDLKFTYANSTVTITDSLSKGKHSITIRYTGNNTFAESNTNVTVLVYGNLTIDASNTNVNSTKKAEVKVNVTNGINTTAYTKEDIKINVTYKEGNDTKVLAIKGNDFTVENGTIKFELENGDFTTANLDITYKNDIKKSVNLTRIYNAKITPIKTENDYGSGEFTFKVVDADTNEILSNKSISVSGDKNGSSLYWITTTSEGSSSISSSTTLKTNANGIISVPNENFYPGLYISTYLYAPAGDDYNFVLSGSGDVKGKETIPFKVNKADISIKVVPYKEYFGSSKKLVINVTNAKNGDPVKGIIVFFNLTDSSGNEMVFTTTNNNTTVKTNLASTSDKGLIELPISNLAKGKYSIVTSINETENNNKASVSSKNIEIKGTPMKLSFSTTTVYYNSGSTLTITVTDKKGKILKDASILVTFQGKKSVDIYPVSNNNILKLTDNTFIYQTDKNGKITIAASLAVGKHKITIESFDSRYDAKSVTKTVTVKKANAKISAPKVTAYYKGGKNLVIKLTNSKTKKIMYGAKVTIRLFISSNQYYSYKGQSGSDGKLRLSLDSLNPGTYKIDVSSRDSKNFAAKKVATSAVVKKAPAKLTPKKLTAKKAASKYFKVTVKNTKTKKVIKGVKVKIKVYTGKSSKTYTVKTNAKGIAQINVKSLKVGTHKVVVSSGNKYVTAKSATSSIKITK